MNSFFTDRRISQLMVLVFSLIILFHLLVLSGIIPFDIVWGGRLKTREDMLRFEAISIAANALMMAIIALRAGWIRLPVPAGVVKVLLWGMVVLFVLNTVGNLLAVKSFETYMFTPMTAVLAIGCARLALKRRER